MALLLSGLGKFQGKGIHKEIAVGKRIASIWKPENRSGLVTNASLEPDNWGKMGRVSWFLQMIVAAIYKLNVLSHTEFSQ